MLVIRKPRSPLGRATPLGTPISPLRTRFSQCYRHHLLPNTTARFVLLLFTFKAHEGRSVGPIFTVLLVS